MEHSLRLPNEPLTRRRGDYGFDEPIWPILNAACGIVALIVGLLSFWVFKIPVLGVVCCIAAIIWLVSAADYIYTTRWGKFQVWAEILQSLNLRGDEQLIDLGCGRGAVLLMAARLLPNGKATGIDVWRTHEQSGNALTVTQRNAELEGVAGRVELHTADARQLPFPDNSFDLAVSSLAIHNIRDPKGRDQAISETARVLKPGGRLVIVDLLEARRYGEVLRELGWTEVGQRALDWRFWYGGPWAAPIVVEARKPA